MKDDDLMPFGKFKGQAMANVPDSYLLWFHKENEGSQNLNAESKMVMDYILDYGPENLRS